MINYERNKLVVVYPVDLIEKNRHVPTQREIKTDTMNTTIQIAEGTSKLFKGRYFEKSTL